MNKFLISSLATLLLTVAVAFADEDSWQDVEITTTRVANGIYMLTGKGGNLGVSVGADGVFLIDDQFAPLSEKIHAAIAKLSEQPVRFVLNTHWHPDHTGGNEILGEAGAVIVSHDNVRKRLSVDGVIKMFNMEASALSPAGLPMITFNDTMTFHLNGDDIAIHHVAHAHTDGDSIVVFNKANVIHTGDTCFSGMYPFIDHDSGGSVKGFIAAVSRLLEMADDNTVIIPGHGPVTNKKELLAWYDMLKTISSRIMDGIRKNDSLAAIQAAKPTAEFDAQYGNGFIKNEAFVEMLYVNLRQGFS